MRATRTGERYWYVLAGLLVGVLGAVRFNGLVLGAVLFAGHLLRGRSWRAARRHVGVGACIAALPVG